MMSNNKHYDVTPGYHETSCCAVNRLFDTRIVHKITD